MRPAARTRVLTALIAASLVLGLVSVGASPSGDAPVPTATGAGPSEAGPAAGTPGRGNPPPHAGRPGGPGNRPPGGGGSDGDGDGNGGWRATPTGLGGLARYDAGEWVHTDFVYDDDERADNAADIVEVRVRPDGDDLAVRVIFNTLRPTDTTVLGLAIATSEGAEHRDWPHGAGVASPWDTFVTVTTAAARAEVVHDPAAPTATEALPAAVDHDANTVEFVVPGVAAGDPVLTLNAGAGLAGAGGWTGSPPVVDLAFNGHDQEPIGANFRSQAQRAAIDSGDVSRFGVEVDVALLRAGHSDPPVRDPGLYNAVYPSRLDLGGGYGGSFPKHRGAFQPYALWIPDGVDLDEPTPLVLVLHSLGQIHNQYNTWSVYDELGDGLGAIAITPLALGTDGWYRNEALVDTLDAWVDVTRRFTVDPERTYSTGYSMGGYGTYRLGTLLPELLAAGVSWVGPPIDGIWLGTTLQDQPNLTYSQLENTNHVPFFIIHGTFDELVPVTGVTRQANRFHDLGHEYRYALHPGQEHFSFAVIDDWTRERVWLRGRARVTDPARVTFKVRPHSWMPPARAHLLPLLEDLAAELGARFDSQYWVRDVVVAGDPAVDRTGYVELTSHGVRNRVPVLDEELGVAVPGSSPHIIRGQTRQFAPAPVENRLTGSITEVSELTVDLAWAQLRLEGLELDVSVDRQVTLHLVDGDQRRTVVLTPEGLPGGPGPAIWGAPAPGPRPTVAPRA